ncbi:MAG: 2-oxoglutarate dehydrogenase complex dihydrolipoyllysine-residue succinyltransferase, partial [Gammaproteobacteria bacterium]|nr:2-oxoglutarate dehydrogenase complex dihydrolipoyllysine-residue succinyltransferase [Gammaproteobacteria bacterium]
TSTSKAPRTSPAVKKLSAELGVDLETVEGSGRDGRILRADVQRAADDAKRSERQASIAGISAGEAPPVGEGGEALTSIGSASDEARVERRVPMTRLRASIARRLVEAQHNAAMLTTFNEVDMSEVARMREKYKDQFAARHGGVRLGFMSFFVSAAVEALKRFPAVNASIDASDIVYHGYYDIGVAVSTEAGLLVPVIRDADALGLAQIEEQIVQYSAKARDGKLSLEELAGGTFTISNGGIFGSLLSTPILNPPQTAILGMHKIQQRPVVVDGDIVVRPMMYLALSYDHRLIDGKEAVQFLVTIKEMVEDPARLLLEI